MADFSALCDLANLIDVFTRPMRAQVTLLRLNPLLPIQGLDCLRYRSILAQCDAVQKERGRPIKSSSKNGETLGKNECEIHTLSHGLKGYWIP